VSWLNVSVKTIFNILKIRRNAPDCFLAHLAFCLSNLHRGHSIDDSYQVSVVAMFVNDRDEMSNLHRGQSIDASYQVSVHSAKQFQRRRFLKIGQSETRIACGGHVW
jgi:hypothetical protein